MLLYQQKNAPAAPETSWPGVPDILRQLLYLRGITTYEDAAAFLAPNVSQLLDPFLLPDMDKACQAVRRALDDRLPICVYGDYDVAGVCASSILYLYFKSIGADVRVYLPSRHNEGYGLNEAAIRSIAAECSLLITVDCGVASADLIALAQSLGLSCVVTDHHLPPENLPACPVVDPSLGGYPFPGLCGAGVAFKLVCALGGIDAALPYIDLAGLATVADLVPLKSENRVLVYEALKQINAHPRLGLQALMGQAGVVAGSVNSQTLGFQLGPRINAGGRLGSARRSFDLLTTDNPDIAHDLAVQLNDENTARRDQEQEIFSQALARLENFNFPAHRILIIDGENWNPGVIGLAASRLTGKFHYPSILLSVKDGVATGSCRSIEGVDIYKTLCQAEDLLTRFGGHRQAAGLTLPAENIPALRERLDAYLFSAVDADAYLPVQEYDAELSFDSLNESLIEDLALLEPTGFGNPAPVFFARAGVQSARAVGSNASHLKLTLSQNDIRIGGIFFRAGDMASSLPSQVDVLFSPTLNTFQGVTKVEMLISSLRFPDLRTMLQSAKETQNALHLNFLTELFYNNRKHPPALISAAPLPPEKFKQLLTQSRQGTLIVTWDVQSALALADMFPEMQADVSLGAFPADERCFSALCVCPTGKCPVGYQNIIYAGCPAIAADAHASSVYSMALAGKNDLFAQMPDITALREAYIACRSLCSRPMYYRTLADLCAILADEAGQSPVTACACILILNDMELVSLTLDGDRAYFSMLPMHKMDPLSSVSYAYIQSWFA